VDLMARPAAYPIWSSFAAARDADLPLQEQLVRFFRDAVASGALRGGARVPATRALAGELGLARNTVGLAYERLIAEGFLEARHGSGTFVSSHLPAKAPATAPTGTRASVDAAGSRSARLLTLMPTQPRGHPRWPLTTGIHALDVFPHALWARLDARYWRRRSTLDLGYGETRGFPPLCEALAAYLGAARGITCSAEQIIVTPGTQAGVLIAALALADAGDRAWVEHPGHESTRRALILGGLEVVGVPVDEQGLDVPAGQRLAPEARLALVAPAHQYPLGVVMSLARRLSLLEWARVAGAFVIEDDYDSEFRYDGAPLQPLKALDGAQGRVVYVGTLSKLLAPGLRLGFMVVPDRLIDVMRAVRATVDRHVSQPLQAVAAEFIGNGHLGAHIRRLRAVHGERRAALLDAVSTQGDRRLRLGGSASGLHMVAHLPEGVDDRAVSNAARAQRIGVSPISGFAVEAAQGDPGSGLLMGFGNTPARAMAGAIRIVSDGLRDVAPPAGVSRRRVSARPSMTSG
jgi:GntR family transcriptional regulator/MocR family aminotransferase